MQSFSWEVIYEDGTSLKQFGETGEISSEQINRKKIKVFILRNRKELPLVTLHLNSKQRLIYRKRTNISQGEQSPNPSNICHLVGWQQTIGGENIQSILYCFEDGRIEFAGKFDEKSEWFYPIIQTEADKIEKE